MILRNWVEQRGWCLETACTAFGVKRTMMFKYLYEGSIPRKEPMKRIYIVTKGQVTADDFYELEPQLLIQKAANDNNNIHDIELYRDDEQY